MRPVDVKSIRAALGLTQEKFSDLIGCSYQSVRAWEQGWRIVPGYIQVSLKNIALDNIDLKENDHIALLFK